ncbi:hypothetical protein C5167_025048 [Papaver somniferum]|uniref:PIPK domain-containing protein n=1 Tax=Papaver somniferum TaxID=3469 RepID=A0A4Y7JU53_PAPSO|nr:hypothetical protein C5167_025048 [Papaver somniferum]
MQHGLVKTSSSKHFSNFNLSVSVSPLSNESAGTSCMCRTILSMSGSRSSMISDPLVYTKASHVRVTFSDDGPLGRVKYAVTCYFAKGFEALRRACCPSELDFLRSLSRCSDWNAQGGKSNAYFAKSLDDRFIIKGLTKTELESFIKLAPEYFKYLSESNGTRSPTCLAKIWGSIRLQQSILKEGRNREWTFWLWRTFCSNAMLQGFMT